MARQKKIAKRILGLGILAINVLIAAYFAIGIASPNQGLAWLTPGKASNGHHQIIESCKTCHVPFKLVNNQVCLDCHAKEMEAMNDTHPESKFLDPRNANLIEKLDATLCITCHGEHDPVRTGEFGVTMPKDFCIECHKDIGETRKSHKGMAFTTCGNAGCHNYHDNRALYEDFLIKHLDEPEPVSEGKVMVKVPLPSSQKSLTAAAHDGGSKATQGILRDWSSTAHAQAGINCNSCHLINTKGKGNWVDKPSVQVCKSCHVQEFESFTGGKHGMRLPLKLSPNIEARLPVAMNDPQLSCQSCHAAHRYEAQFAATEACIRCHADNHSRAYNGSPHHLLWLNEVAGKGKPGSGVSCATCHMPRVEAEGGKNFVDHNQNHNFQPNEKMIRSVCLNCHALDFSLKALADPKQILENFRHQPDFELPTMDMARDRK